MPKSMNETSPGWGTVLKLIGQGIAAGSRAQNLVFRAIGLDRERDCPAFNNLFVKEFQGGPWFQSNLFQNRFRLSFQSGSIRLLAIALTYRCGPKVAFCQWLKARGRC